jgi:hypothetical protein
LGVCPNRAAAENLDGPLAHRAPTELQEGTMGIRFRIASSLVLTAVALSLATSQAALLAQTHV